MNMMLTPSDLRATIGAGMTVNAARKVLRCPTKVIRQWARFYGMVVPERPAKVRGEDKWREAVRMYGPGLRAIARGLDMDPKWVGMQLQRYNIDPGMGRSGNPNFRKAEAA